MSLLVGPMMQPALSALWMAVFLTAELFGRPTARQSTAPSFCEGWPAPILDACTFMRRAFRSILTPRKSCRQGKQRFKLALLCVLFRKLHLHSSTVDKSEILHLRQFGTIIVKP